MGVVSPHRWVRDVCKVGRGHACCRYLVGTPTGVECAKFIPQLREVLDSRVLNKTIVARGDNCPGFKIQDILQ